MRAYRLAQFGIDHLRLEPADDPAPGKGEVLIDLKALSLNYRDLMVVKGWYNPKLKLPVVPISDGAGVVAATGPGVEGVAIGDRVISHFVSGWIGGPFRAEYGKTTLGTPGPGLAAERVVLPASAVVPVPAGYDFAQAATLPIAALTAWSVLVNVGRLEAGQSVLTLGTGGVSIFALQFAKALGAKVIITSSSDEKLRRAQQLGADYAINYTTAQDWASTVAEVTGGLGADVTVETGGAGTLTQSMAATRAGGTIGFLGALTGLKAEVNLGLLLMKRLHLAGIFVDSRASFEAMNRFITEHDIRPVINRSFSFDDLGEAFRYMESGRHFGKIVVQI
ncbi:MAG TPA: NAD(P)-dependent alcohol dehydrogenase [Phycisphaerae bacterium]|nr:NAD(P)-dependent alcohol dehydrogenase [Phycisphaerae bacterium]